MNTDTAAGALKPTRRPMTVYDVEISGRSIWQHGTSGGRSPDDAVRQFMRRLGGIRYTNYHCGTYARKPQPPTVKLNWTAATPDKEHRGMIKLVLVPCSGNLYTIPDAARKLIPTGKIDAHIRGS